MGEGLLSGRFQRKFRKPMLARQRRVFPAHHQPEMRVCRIELKRPGDRGIAWRRAEEFAGIDPDLGRGSREQQAKRDGCCGDGGFGDSPPGAGGGRGVAAHGSHPHQSDARCREGQGEQDESKERRTAHADNLAAGFPTCKKLASVAEVRFGPGGVPTVSVGSAARNPPPLSNRDSGLKGFINYEGCAGDAAARASRKRRARAQVKPKWLLRPAAIHPGKHPPLRPQLTSGMEQRRRAPRGQSPPAFPATGIRTCTEGNGENGGTGSGGAETRVNLRGWRQPRERVGSISSRQVTPKRLLRPAATHPGKFSAAPRLSPADLPVGFAGADAPPPAWRNLDLDLLDGGDSEHAAVKDPEKGFAKGRNLAANVSSQNSFPPHCRSSARLSSIPPLHHPRRIRHLTSPPPGRILRRRPPPDWSRTLGNRSNQRREECRADREGAGAFPPVAGRGKRELGA